MHRHKSCFIALGLVVVTLTSPGLAQKSDKSKAGSNSTSPVPPRGTGLDRGGLVIAPNLCDLAQLWMASRAWMVQRLRFFSGSY